MSKTPASTLKKRSRGEDLDSSSEHSVTVTAKRKRPRVQNGKPSDEPGHEQVHKHSPEAENSAKLTKKNIPSESSSSSDKVGIISQSVNTQNEPRKKGKSGMAITADNETAPTADSTEADIDESTPRPIERPKAGAVSKGYKANKEKQPKPKLSLLKRIKLDPPRPAPSVPSSSNATGPRSARAEGNNVICVSRKVELGAYLRRCKKVILEEGYKTLHLHAMAAAIPHLVLLATSLPDILPYGPDEIRTEYFTGTVQCVDEVFPQEEEEIFGDEPESGFHSSLETRNKSRLEVKICIGDGEREITGREKKQRKRSRGKHSGAQSASHRGAKDIEDAMSTDSD